jgi:hypothetical protein
MARKRKNTKTKTEETAYLTKRILVTAAKAGIRRAARETMELMGYTIVAQGNWVVKKYQDGHTERISPITRHKRPANIVLK